MNLKVMDEDCEIKLFTVADYVLYDFRIPDFGTAAANGQIFHFQHF